jgi:hypothetical protein
MMSQTRGYLPVFICIRCSSPIGGAFRAICLLHCEIIVGRNACVAGQRRSLGELMVRGNASFMQDSTYVSGICSEISSSSRDHNIDFIFLWTSSRKPTSHFHISCNMGLGISLVFQPLTTLA